LKLPNADSVVIPKAKIVDYLLSPTHRSGKSKENFFTSFGFSLAEWTELRDALRAHAAAHKVAKQDETIFGARYAIDGEMRAPDGSRLNVRTVWFIDTGARVPRFVTAHPQRKRKP
jgi:hypothetical protein